MARRPRMMRLLGVALIALALLIGLYVVVAYIGLQSGRTLREERLQQAREAELTNQMQRSRTEIEAGNFALASRRLQWVLEQDPGYPQARELLDEAQEGVQGGRPQAEATPDGMAPTPQAGDTSGEAGDAAASRLRQAEQLLEQALWDQAITALINLQHEYPNYERRQTDELLHRAYIAQGVDLLYGEQIELGLYYLDQAQRLGDLPQDVRDQQHWAELYLGGMGYFGVNWEVTLFYFRDLCLAAPFFHEACSKLVEALVAYGDLYAAQLDWCPAQGLYEEAWRHDDADSVTQKLRRARQGCADATPTAPITETVPFSGTLPLLPGGLAPPTRSFQVP